MTTKIFKSIVLAVIFCITVCTALFLSVLYSYFEDQVFDELAGKAALAGQGVALSGTAYLEGLSTENRLTLILPDGTVAYDSEAAAETMENHADREEIAEALETGCGRSSHYSKVYLAKTLYYALRLADGSIIRVSCVQNTVISLLFGMLTPILWILLLSLIAAGLLAARLARRITRPINEIDLDHPSSGDTYQELSPLLGRIRQQNFTIHQQIEELGRRQREFTAITENMSEGFVLIDDRANIISYNTSALRILSAEPADPSRSVLQLNRSREFRSAVDASLAGEHTETLLRLSGRCYQLLGNPVSANGQVTGAVLMILDVTEREQREELRREFSANVSHELKTPLTSISGFAELMKDGLVGEDGMREFAGDIYTESQRLITLVEDILRLSALDETDFSPEREDVDLYDLAADVAAYLKPAAEKRRVSIELTGEHAVVFGVRQILEEMLYNLCDNAIKYNRPGGSVHISVAKDADKIRLRVADTGIGIPREQQPRVFERFYRVDKSHSKQIGGTGLGLSIVKHGAQFHNAQVELESEEGHGTTVTIVF